MPQAYKIADPLIFPTDRFPFGSVVLLIFSYIVFSISLSEISHSWGALIFTIIWVVLRTLILIFPQLSSEQWVFRAFGSDAMGFTLLVITAALISIVVTWLHFFLQVLLIVAAEILARVNLSVASFKGWQSFVLLSFLPIMGIWLGWALIQYCRM